MSPWSRHLHARLGHPVYPATLVGPSKGPGFFSVNISFDVHRVLCVDDSAINLIEGSPIHRNETASRGGQWGWEIGR